MTLTLEKATRFISLLLLAVVTSFSLSMGAHAGLDLFNKSSKPKFLPVHEAFQSVQRIQKTKQGTQLHVDFVVVPKHYLYKQRIKLKVNGKTVLPATFSKKAKFVNDPEFGRVPVFEENMSATFNLPKNIDASKPVKLKWQGCAKAGLCYPPVTETVALASLKKKALTMPR